MAPTPDPRSTAPNSQPDSRDLSTWSGVEAPRRETLTGTWVDLVPLDPVVHAHDLWEASTGVGVQNADERFRWLPETAPVDRALFDAWLAANAGLDDPLFVAVVDRATGRAEGRQCLMRIDAANGVAEIGNILWGPGLSRKRGATEAFFLAADWVFSHGYRRFEWKCDNDNAPSKAAAARFGFAFEGTFRQHRVVKGINRDTAWFSIIDSEWPRLRAEYVRWLDASNFDAKGQQLSRLDTRG